MANAFSNYLSNIFQKKPQTPASVVQTAQKNNYALTSPSRQAAQTSTYVNPYKQITQTASTMPKVQPAKPQVPSFTDYIANKAKQTAQSVIRDPRQAISTVGKAAQGYGVLTNNPVVNTLGFAASRYSQPRPTTPTTQPPVQPKPVIPKPIAPPTVPQPQTDPLSAFYERTQANQTGAIDAQSELDRKYLSDLYDKNRSYLEGSVPVLLDNFNKYKSDVQSGIGDQEAQTAEEKRVIADQFGTSQRERASVRRDQQAAREGQYAALNTIDSTGVGSFTAANTNDDADFQRRTDEAIAARDKGFITSDRELSQYKRQAQGLIDAENSKLQDAVRKIISDISLNDDEKKYQIDTVYKQAAAQKQGVIDQYNGLRLESAQKLASGGDPKVAADLRAEYQGRTKDNNFNVVNQTLQKIQTAPDNAAGDMGMIFGYMKLLDPNSTVREGEYATAQQATGVPQQVLNQYNNVIAGRRLNPDQRRQFTAAAVSYAQPVIQQQQEAEKYYRELARRQGIDPYSVIGGYTTSGNSNQNDPLGLGL